MNHTFHIPVLGLGYSIDTPLKVAKYGISSVVSIVDDELTERMREFHAKQNAQVYIPISKHADDSRAKRITAYLDLLQELVHQQIVRLKNSEDQKELISYFDMLPDHLPLKRKYLSIMKFPKGNHAQGLAMLKTEIEPGSIDVNIMSKVDKANYDRKNQYLGDNFTDALAAMRGFAESKLDSAVILSAGLNPRLYAYMETLDCFYPSADGTLYKRIILKVSDFRSAMIQAKLLAKKGLWVSEFRIESGLNCGGHAFATDGFLLGPILEEFKTNKKTLFGELESMYHEALTKKNYTALPHISQKITAQGGIGTAAEHDFLLKYYELDAAGWGSPFLLVPEATNVDDDTINALERADGQDYFLSTSSPLGVLFNNFRPGSAEQQRLERIRKGRPGSPCRKKYLCTNTEFTVQPICTASREYQNLKIKSIMELNLAKENEQQAIDLVTAKTCLCEGLCASVYIKNGILKPKENTAVSICPGPNLAYFSRKYSLKEMVDHIYGRQNLLENINRPNLFINELNLYVEYLKKDIATHLHDINSKRLNYYNKFKAQLLEGINYYKRLIPELNNYSGFTLTDMYNQLKTAENELLLTLK